MFPYRRFSLTVNPNDCLDGTELGKITILNAFLGHTGAALIQLSTYQKVTEATSYEELEVTHEVLLKTILAVLYTSCCVAPEWPKSQLLLA